MSVVPTVTQTQPLEQRSLLSASPIGGEGNNVANPEWGTVGEQFIRIAPDDYGDGISSLAGADRPSAREISNEVAAEGDEAAPSRDLWSAMIWVWGQFVDHDLDLTNTGTTEALSIAVPTGDPFFDSSGTGTATINTMRSEFDPATGLSADNPRQQVNSLTSFIDASMVYGSDAARATALRTLSGGKLKTSDGDLLPRNSTEFFPDGPLANAVLPTTPADEAFVAGDVRANENVVLTALHTIWVREHNFQAERIAADHPDWSDEQIYQGARERVIAEIQAITYNEFLPALMGSNAPTAQAYAYRPDEDATITNSFAAAVFRFGHSAIGNSLLLANNNSQATGSLAFASAFFNPNQITNNPTLVDQVLMGASLQTSQEIDLKIVDSIRNVMFGPPGAGGTDLMAVDIQRGRDHGIVDYNELRVAYGLPLLTSFNQLPTDATTRNALKTLYGNNINNVDAIVAALAETHLPGSSLGPLTTAILVNQFERSRDGDKFFYTADYNELYAGGVLKSDIAAILNLNTVKLADVIKWNTGLTNISSNLFFAPTLTPATPIAGDFNNDGVVNNADLTVWKSGFAAGTMTGADYLLWQRNFGATSATVSVAAVPEPASACLAVLAAFAVSHLRRRASRMA